MTSKATRATRGNKLFTRAFSDGFDRRNAGYSRNALSADAWEQGHVGITRATDAKTRNKEGAMRKKYAI